MARALAAAIAVSLLAASGAAGTDTQKPRRGGTVVVMAPFEPACLNWLRKGCLGTTSAVLERVLVGAFDIGPRQVRRNLVSGVKYTSGPPFTLVYHIRPEARWSDGVPVTARDFVFTHAAIRKYVPPDTETGLSYHRQEVRSVRTLDAKTVRVVLNSRSAGWRSLFGTVLPRHVLAGQDLEDVWSESIDNPKTGEPIGSGPFLVKRWERGKQLTLVRNPRYWGPHPAYLDRLVLRFSVGSIPDALREGELDVVQYRPDPAFEPALRGIAGVKQHYGPGRILEHFEIRIRSGGNPTLEKKLVRRALAYGIDRVEIAHAVYGNVLPKGNPSDSAVFLFGTPFYRPNWKGYRYRPAVATRLLEEAGCHRGADGVYICGEERLALRFVSPEGPQTRRRIALEFAQAQLRRIGVEVRPSYALGRAFFGQILPSGDFDVALLNWQYGPDDVPADIYGCRRSLNYTGYCQRLVTQALDRAEGILDPGQRAQALNKADRLMANDVPVIPLWNEPLAAAVRSTIHGVVPSFPSLIWNAENWWLER